MIVALIAVLVVALAGGAWAWAGHRDDAVAEQDGAAADRVAAAAAEAQAADAVDAAEHDAAVTTAQTTALLAGVRADLQSGVDAADATLTTSQGQVADETLRQTLAAQVTAADAALAAGSSGYSAASLRTLTASLASANAAVVTAHDAWVAAKAAADAAAAAAAAAKKPTTSTGTSSAPSCGTTYNGPPFYTSPPTVGGDGSNGKLPPSALAAISWAKDPHGTPYYLRTNAAAALEKLDKAFRAEFGHHLGLDLTYRDYDTQVAMRAALGSVAAVPGTSTHGTGLALDVPELPCEYGWDTPQRTWLVTHGPSYGWTSPSWAHQNGSNPEYWHFDYVG